MACKGDHLSSLLCLRKGSASSPSKFHWSIAAAGFDVDDIEVHETVLRMITVLYITIRGFAYANASIEQYRQMQKKSTQRSKSLRKQLYTNKNS